jgi:hypothetical protein
MTKRLCVLQVTPETPNEDHVRFFKDKEECDFFFVTHDAPHKDALKYCPNTTWVDTRNILADMVPKQYEYYAFVDYDFIFSPQKELGVLEQILHDLDQKEPAVLTYYPGPGFITPFNSDKEYFNKYEYSIIPFTHCGMKVVHHSLMDWFFPMLTRFGGGVDACHFFNIQEIPFLSSVVCSHNMIYDNAVTDMNTPHNRDGAWSMYRMNQSWEWLQSAFKKNGLLHQFGNSAARQQFKWCQEDKFFKAMGGDPRFQLDSLDIKNVFIDIFKLKQPKEKETIKRDNFYDISKIENFFDLDHEFFINKDRSLSEQMSEINEEFEIEVSEILRKNVTFNTLKSRSNPWPSIVKVVNETLTSRRDITVVECHEIFQKMKDNKAIFYKNSILNEGLRQYLDGKTVALVGPAPYLIGQKRGKIIDEHDVVVRIQPEVFSTEDYGSRTDIIQSCMNSSYSPKIAKYLQNVGDKDRPAYIISNNTVSRETYPGSKMWSDVVEEYDTYLKKYGVPFAHLKCGDGTFDRWALYWEIYAKKHIEKIDNSYTVYSGNLNSGYGAYSMLLSYPIKQLSVFGMDFYNFGKYSKIEDKYNPEYIKQQGQEGTYLGPDVMVHDIMAQAMHMKNVLLQDDRFKYDAKPLSALLSDEMESRFNTFKKLPRLNLFETE